MSINLKSKNLPLNDDTDQTISLLTTTTGLIDAHIIVADQQLSWILPQNLILDVVDIPSDTYTLNWRKQELPILSLVDPVNRAKNLIMKAVIIEARNDAHRFAVLTTSDLISRRIRISELHDDEDSSKSKHCYQVVRLEGTHYQIPDVDLIIRQIHLH